MNIKFSPPDITEAEIKEVVDTLRSGWITTGPKTKLLEKKFAEYTGTNMFACMSSATACMEMTLRLLGIKEGDEVITSAYTYSASASVICHVGAKPVIVDTQADSFEISAESVEAALTERTKAVITVDFGGIICNYSNIKSALESKKYLYSPKNEIQSAFDRVIIVADAAHSFGSIRDCKKSGLHADFSCFSFHAIKNLAMGEGGAVTWKPIKDIEDADIYKQYMRLSLHGQTKDALSKTQIGAWEYDIAFPGYKCNLTDIMASLGLIQLQRYESLLARRAEIVKLYDEIIGSEKVETLKHEGVGFISNKHLFIARIIGKGEEYRNSVIKKMAEREISTNVHFKPLPMFTAYKNLGFDIDNYPNAFNQYKNAISLPIHTMLSDHEVKYIAENFVEILQIN